MTDWSEHRPTIEDVKATVTVPEVAELLGIEVGGNDKIASPWNQGERTPSCHLYEDHFFCYATGKGGDVIDLVRAFYPDMTVNDVVRKIWHRALRCGLEPGHVERQPVRQVADFTDQLPPLDPDEDMKLLPWTMRLGVHVSVGCRVLDGNLLIPHADQDGVYGVKVREPGGAKSAWPGSQFTKRLYDPGGWSGPRWAHIPESMALIAEGESDCWALSAALSEWGQVRFLALPSGAQSWKDSWLADLEPFEKVWICLDNDDAGKRARDKLTRKIGFLRAEQLRVPPLYNDAREAIGAGWRPTL